MKRGRPHLLGIDDGPFDKRQREPVPIVGVLMEGRDLVEGVAVMHFPVDGADATDFLGGWIEALRWRRALHAVVLGGITLAGLGVVDLGALAARLGVPLLSVTRRPTADSRLPAALAAARLPERLAIAHGAPDSIRIREGLYATVAGATPARAAALLEASLHKSQLPEPLRLAHLIAAALARGSSRGRA